MCAPCAPPKIDLAVAVFKARNQQRAICERGRAKSSRHPHAQAARELSARLHGRLGCPRLLAPAYLDGGRRPKQDCQHVRATNRSAPHVRYGQCKGACLATGEGLLRAAGAPLAPPPLAPALTTFRAVEYGNQTTPEQRSWETAATLRTSQGAERGPVGSGGVERQGGFKERVREHGKGVRDHSSPQNGETRNMVREHGGISLYYRSLTAVASPPDTCVSMHVGASARTCLGSRIGDLQVSDGICECCQANTPRVLSAKASSSRSNAWSNVTPRVLWSPKRATTPAPASSPLSLPEVRVTTEGIEREERGFPVGEGRYTNNRVSREVWEREREELKERVREDSEVSRSPRRERKLRIETVLNSLSAENVLGLQQVTRLVILARRASPVATVSWALGLSQGTGSDACDACFCLQALTLCANPTPISRHDCISTACDPEQRAASRRRWCDRCEGEGEALPIARCHPCAKCDRLARRAVSSAWTCPPCLSAHIGRCFSSWFAIARAKGRCIVTRR